MKTVKRVDFPAQLQMSSAKELGIAVRSARTGAGFTLASAAQALGISKQTLSDLELGTGTVTLTLAFRRSTPWACPCSWCLHRITHGRVEP